MPKYSPDDPAFRRLVQLINEWNDDHYDIFALSQPNEELEFHGVMRFFFQDAGAKVATKCIRVASTATAKEVVDVLVEKFHPDMRMLTMNEYNLYEVHVNDERKLADDECPLFIQLNWGADMREGRFLLKCAREITPKDEAVENERGIGGFKRKLSKREKKEKKKREKERLKNKENLSKDSTIAEKLYTDVPENSFTRSISNPEAVMRRRRQQKVEKRLQQFRNETGSESGGMLKIHGEALSPNVPYKTLLVSATDTAYFVVEETLDKYGLPKDDAYKYCLVQVTVPKGEREYHGGSLGDEKILDDDECPLAILLEHAPERDCLMFQLRLRPPQDDRKKERMRAAVSHNDLRSNQDKNPPQQSRLPYLVELHRDGGEIIEGRRHYLQSSVTEVGSEKSVSESGQYLQLFGKRILPHHCVIAHMDGSVTLTPIKSDAETFIDDEHVSKTTLLQDGMIVRFGLNHIFRFSDSRSDEDLSYHRRSVSPNPRHQPIPYPDGIKDDQNKPFETTFELNGQVETLADQNLPRGMSREDLHKNAPNHSPHSPGRHGASSGRSAEVLPAALEFREEAEDQFLRQVILNTKCNTTQFKLAPTYTLYLAIRHCLSNGYYPDLPPQERAVRLTNFIHKISGIMQQAIEDSREDPAALAFLMANTSETYNFIKQDQDTRLFSREAQEVMAESVQMAFHHLVGCLQYDLQQTMPAFIDDDDSVEDDDFGVAENMNRNNQRMSPTLGDVLRTLSAAMNLLRRCRVNAALTIQLFSQLFHFINMWLFNILIQKPNLRLCTRRWGIRLKRRLGRVEAWAEKQGLELAADCHLCRIIQAAHLLQAPKNNSDDIANISSTCFKLNSLQVRALLQYYIPEDNEPHIPQALIDRMVAVAMNMADDLAQSDGSEIHLEEHKDLQLPFLLPEDGYSCDIIRGVPNGLPEYLEPYTQAGICRLIPQPNSKELWTVHMIGPDQQGPKLNELHHKEVSGPHLGQGPRSEELPKEPEIVEVSFEKVKGSIGLSIVAAKGDGQMSRGIYIKSVVPGGAAALDGRLQAGDQLLEVDGRSLVGLSQEKAANLMTKTGNVVCLKVSKQGAIYHGLATLLSQPSPIMQRANGPKKPAQHRHRSEENLFNGPHRESERPQVKPQPAAKPEFRETSLPRQPPLQMNDSRPPYPRPGPQSSPSPNSEGSGQDPRSMRYPPNNFPHPDANRPPQHHQQHWGEDPRSRSSSSLRPEEMGVYQKQMPPHQNIHGSISASALTPTPNANIPGDDYRMLTNNKRSPPQRQPHPESNSPAQQPMPSQQAMPSQPPYMNGNVRQIYEQRPQHMGADPPHFAGPIQRPPDQDPKIADNRYMDQHPRGPDNARHMNYYNNKADPGKYQHPGKDHHRNSYGPPDRGNNYTPSPIPTYQPKPMVNHSSTMNHSPVSSLPKDDRPYSMAPPVSSHERPEFGSVQLRPHSDDISADKVREWQEKYDVDYSNNSYNHAGPLEQPIVKHPHFMESPEQISATSHYAKISPETREINDIPKASVNNQARQQHFYEKTKQRIQEPAPPFHQLQRAGDQEIMKKPAVPPKTITLKSVDKGSPVNGIPMINVHDKRPIQPQSQMQVPPQNVYNVRYAHQQQQKQVVQSRPIMPHQATEKPKTPDMTGGGSKSNLQEIDQSDLPPPPEIPPDLPPPPAPEDLQEMMPPPPQDVRMTYHSDTQHWQHQQQQVTHRYNGPHDFGSSIQNYKSGSPGQRGQEFSDGNRVPPMDQNNYKTYPTQVNNYDGTSYDRRSVETQGPPSLQHVSNSHEDPRMSYPQSNVSPPRPPVNASNNSNWDREDKTKILKQEDINMNRIRETEIQKLSEMKYRTPQEEDRLKKLCLEEEFQRRVQEVGDDDDNESETEISPYRQQSQEWLIKNIQEDLQKTLNRLREIDEDRASKEYKKETERMQRLRQRLEIFEKEREEDRKKLQRRQQQKMLEQEQHLQKQRDLREKQRRDFEEQRKIHLLEEEKMRDRKIEELKRKKELEREQVQAAREAEEELQRRNEEKRKLDQQMRQQGNVRYNDGPTSDYSSINLYPAQHTGMTNSTYLDHGPSVTFPPPPPPEKTFQSVPQPPERGSSYETLNQYQIRAGMKPPQEQASFSDNPQYNNVGRNTSASALRSNLDVTAPKKSVSFKPQLETRINPSFSSYPSSSSSHTSDQFNPTESHYQEHDDLAVSPTIPNSDVFDMSQPQTTISPPPVTHPKPTEVHYRTAEVPGVIGSQEIYRDPRTRIQAKKAANSAKMPGPERMSFRDKMKYFAQEAGENTPKEKPKASRLQRNIESTMNGQ